MKLVCEDGLDTLSRSMNGVTGRPWSFSVSLCTQEQKQRLILSKCVRRIVDSELLFQLKTENLVEELLQQTVQPGLGHGHRPGLVGDVAHLHHDLHQLRRKRMSRVKRPEHLYHNCLPWPYHFLVLLVAKIKHGLDDLEPVEDLVVPCHVCGQDAPGRTRRSQHRGR